MITALDTNILLDLLSPTSEHYEDSFARHIAALQGGDCVISDPVLAEIAARFPDREHLSSFLGTVDVSFVPSDETVLWHAGRAWQRYTTRRDAKVQCVSCGRKQEIRCDGCGGLLRLRPHVLADFLIGAHAASKADRLLTRDLGYYKTYFPELTLA